MPPRFVHQSLMPEIAGAAAPADAALRVLVRVLARQAAAEIFAGARAAPNEDPSNAAQSKP